jgi:hypothetical protein
MPPLGSTTTGGFTKAELGPMLSDLDGDPNVSLGSKLLVEELRYEFGVLTD